MVTKIFGNFLKLLPQRKETESSPSGPTPKTLTKSSFVVDDNDVGWWLDFY